jgi:G:T/U-mismatch repair DNA glycosylase
MEDEEMMAEDMPVDAGAAPEAPMDFKALSAQLQSLSDMIAQIQAQLPQDSAEEVASELDEGSAETQAMPPSSGAKAAPAASKSSAIAELSKLMG